MVRTKFFFLWTSHNAIPNDIDENLANTIPVVPFAITTIVSALDITLYKVLGLRIANAASEMSE